MLKVNRLLKLANIAPGRFGPGESSVTTWPRSHIVVRSLLRASVSQATQWRSQLVASYLLATRNVLVGKSLISLAHPTRFERVTFAFGGRYLLFPARSYDCEVAPFHPHEIGLIELHAEAAAYQGALSALEALSSTRCQLSGLRPRRAPGRAFAAPPTLNSSKKPILMARPKRFELLTPRFVV
jgi:hypothetical protein